MLFVLIYRYLYILRERIRAATGEIIENEMRLSEIGLFLKQQLENTPAMSGNIMLDAYVIMPDHFHCIIIRDDDFVQPMTN